MLILHGTTNPNQPTTAPAPSLRVACHPPVKSPAKSLDPSIPTAPATSLRVAQLTSHPDDATVPMDNRTTSRLHPPPTISTKSTTHNWCQPQCSPHLHALHAKQCHPVDPIQHTALHGNAFNPDTGELAKYKELSTSSDGTLWQQANATEIHCLAQGTPVVPGTNTMFFIPVTAIPPGHHATYLCIICAH